ncbi:MAG: hypothetical protein RLZZ546_3028, partial [Bacteroidota bacterium]
IDSMYMNFEGAKVRKKLEVKSLNCKVF